MDDDATLVALQKRVMGLFLLFGTLLWLGGLALFASRAAGGFAAAYSIPVEAGVVLLFSLAVFTAGGFAGAFWLGGYSWKARAVGSITIVIAAAPMTYLTLRDGAGAEALPIAGLMNLVLFVIGAFYPASIRRSYDEQAALADGAEPMSWTEFSLRLAVIAAVFAGSFAMVARQMVVY